jgi:zinc/manganese transport system substrate-binding protein
MNLRCTARFRTLIPALLVGLALVLAGPVQAQGPVLEVVATTATLGMLAREVGGDQVSVRVLAAPDRDPHALDARPAFMAALRRAGLLLEVGAGLEEGWLPAAVSGAANPRLGAARGGHFRAADHLQLRRSITMDGPNLGHVHAEGNPHFQLDPQRVAALAEPLARRLAGLLPEWETAFHARAMAVRSELLEQAARLGSQVAPGQRFVAYHEDIDYFEEWLPVRVAGYLEPLPGVPPTARHLRSLVDGLSDGGPHGVVLHAAYQPRRGAEYLESQLGWARHALPMEPPVDARLAEYLALMRHWAGIFSQEN